MVLKNDLNILNGSKNLNQMKQNKKWNEFRT